MSRDASRTDLDRRAEQRFRIQHPAILQSKSAGVAAVRILEVSRFGLCITIPFCLPLLDEVEVRIDGSIVQGQVRRCVCVRATEFHAGIEVRHFMPSREYCLDHLPILRRVMALQRLAQPVKSSANRLL